MEYLKEHALLSQKLRAYRLILLLIKIDINFYSSLAVHTHIVTPILILQTSFTKIQSIISNISTFNKVLLSEII